MAEPIAGAIVPTDKEQAEALAIEGMHKTADSVGRLQFLASTGSSIGKVIKEYGTYDFPGVKPENGNLEQLKPSIASELRPRTPPFTPRGPVGFLLMSIASMGACLDSNLQIILGSIFNACLLPTLILC